MSLILSHPPTLLGQCQKFDLKFSFVTKPLALTYSSPIGHSMNKSHSPTQIVS